LTSDHPARGELPRMDLGRVFSRLGAGMPVAARNAHSGAPGRRAGRPRRSES